MLLILKYRLLEEFIDTQGFWGKLVRQVCFTQNTNNYNVWISYIE